MNREGVVNHKRRRIFQFTPQKNKFSLADLQLAALIYNSSIGIGWCLSENKELAKNNPTFATETLLP